jgi:agmatine deiminase
MSKTASASPKDYRLPAEFEPQEATWLSWPSVKESCPKTYQRLQDKFGEIAATLTRYQRVRINAPEMMHMGIRLSIADNEGDLSQVDLYNHPTNDIWCRDHGPLFIKNTEGKVAIADFKFNAWGEKFPPYDLDNGIPAKVAEVLKMERFTSNYVIEGGAIESNGAGVIITSEAVMLDPKRNPGATKKDIEAELKRMFGVKTVFWLGKGIAGDDTGGHVDDMVRWVREDAVLCMIETKENDANFKVLKDNRERLNDLRTADGGKVEIFELEMPNSMEVKDWRLDRLPASYANFMLANNALFLPTFKQKKKDATAEDVICELFPGRELNTYDGKDFIMEGGALHCISMHQPKAG